MHDYCGRTHARMDGALGGQPRGDRGVGRTEPTVTVPDVERDVDYANWFPGEPGARVRKGEEGKKERDESG
eukprot:1888570-Rhodomonas_salina.1